MVFSLFPSFQQPSSFNLINQDNNDIFNDIDPEVSHFANNIPRLNSEHSDYYSIDKFNKYFISNVNDLNIIHCDIRSLYYYYY